MSSGSITVSTPLGTLAITERDGALVAIDWHAPPASQRRSTVLLQRAKSQLERYFAGALTQFALPCAPAGTAFQQRVWAALCRIPYGETITYGELARRVGSAPRAVGAACGANPLPIVIPCHRVVARNGALHGYSGMGGLDTKARLLALERGEADLFGSGADRPGRIAS
ncbi:MAG: methylated-DNA--[protein]-cysteine S-methyltransferase [Gemmatimonas sp.]